MESTSIQEIYSKAHKEALQLIEAGLSKNDILSFLTKAAENAAGADTVSSILLLDSNGLLRNGASPRLPTDYLKAIDRLKPDANVGTCMAAAATGKIVITEDFYADGKWAELRHLPLALGFKSAWSFPVTNEEGKVLGTFGTYFSRKRKPTEAEIEGVRLLARAAARVIETSA
jgi:GAF domain-containing protein